MNELYYQTNSFHLYNTFYNGQCFRWEQISDGIFEGIAQDKPLRISQVDDGVVFECDANAFDFWKEYFDLETDYNGIQNTYLQDDILAPCVRAGLGMHILRQDIWEVLISFVISQNNNILRIKKIIQKLSQTYGEAINAYGKTFFAFPSPDVLAEVKKEEFEALGLGYRSEYIATCAKLVSSQSDFLTELSSLNYNDARKKLLSVRGIGPKVANCILLFGLRHFDAFPVDTWIHKAMTNLYPDSGNNILEIERFAQDKFGKNAGLVQQYIFYAARQGAIKFE